MLRAESVSVSLGGRAVLRGVSTTIPCGSVVALLGPNGAGKSTLLRTLAGEIQPVSGNIWMDGRPLSRWTVQERAQRRAVLPQESTLAFPFSCLEVVLMGRTPHRGPAPSADERLTDRIIARTALELVGLASRMSDSYDTLSGGQRQLVHFARVLAQIWEPPAPPHPHRCLLLDEPTASLDLRYQHLVLSRAQKLAREGAAVVAVLHEVNLAAQYADVLCVLKDGVIVAEGAPGKVLSTALLREVFGLSVGILKTPSRPIVVPGLHDTETQPLKPELEVR